MPNTTEIYTGLKVVVIIQARMASMRLPEKVMREISGEPMLAHVVKRARRAQTVDKVVVATTTDEADDAVTRFCAQRDVDSRCQHATDQQRGAMPSQRSDR